MDTLTILMTYKEQKHWLPSRAYSAQFALRAAHFFVLVINRWWQKKSSKAFNQIGQGNFAATVTEIQLIEWWIDVLSP